jgi:nicotinamide-nucleotide amidase
MKAYLISIGDELLIGQTVNTNVAYIGDKLNENQIKIIKNVSIGDDRETILKEFDLAFNETDLVIVTGGLGPTHDDITKACIAEYFDLKLVQDENTLSRIKEFFRKRDREMTQLNEQQAMVPEDSSVIPNENGTAPGMWIEQKDKTLISLPGVPYEMKPMLDNHILPELNKKYGKREKHKVTVNLSTTGIPESVLYDKLERSMELPEDVHLAYLPNQYGVKMRITSIDNTEEDAHDKMSEVEQRIRALAGRYIYSKNEEDIENVVARLLIDRGLTVAVAESCTGGLISNRLTNISGSSAFFERGFITYSNGAKVELLKVDEDFIQEYGAVSLEVARQMAEGVKAVSGTDIGLSVTGIMGPTGATDDKPVGLVYVGICDDKICSAKAFRFGDDRLLNKDRTAQAALDMLRRNLLGIPYDE